MSRDKLTSTFLCYQRLALLSKDRTRRWFVEAIEEARRKYAFDLWAWVVMPEHIHLLVWPRLAVYEMDAILADLKRPVGRRAIGWVRNTAPLSSSG